MTEPEQETSPTQVARDWIMRLSSGDISEEELAAYRAWAEEPEHAAVFQHELALWRSLDAIGDRLAPARPERRRRWGLAAGVAAAAAAVAMLVAAPEAMLRMRADYHSSVAVRSVVLPDGSRAMLDADSAIALHYAANERRVELLRGRAWFDVVHAAAAPFRVTAGGGTVEDVGTAFEVRAEGDGAEAAVTQGEVRILSPHATGPALSLKVGQRARWAADGVPRRLGDQVASRIAAWREGDILLDTVAVRAAVAEIGRYRAGPTFVIGDVDALPPVTAIIRADRPDEGLTALGASARLEILHLPGGIAIVRPAS